MCAADLCVTIRGPLNAANLLERMVKMKAAIHPKYYQVKVRCNCGNEFVTGSTKEEIHVEICSKCHPFYTGSQKMLVESGGRVERFKKKYNIK